MLRMPMAIVCVLLAMPTALAQAPESPIDRYRNLEFPPKEENFDRGWQERVAVEFDIINKSDAKELLVALDDPSPYVRSIAARALGIRGDKSAADALATLAANDKEYIVRIRAVESLGLLKAKPEVVAVAMKDRELGVQWVAKLAADQLKSKTDFAAELRKEYAKGIDREAIGSAKLGKPAPDFTARGLDGKEFQLSSLLGKKPIAIYFAAFDG